MSEPDAARPKVPETKADVAITHLVRRIAGNPRLAYYFDPLTESMSLLTAAYADVYGLDVESFRKDFYAALRFEAPRCRGCPEAEAAQ